MKSKYQFIEKNVEAGQWDLKTAAKEAYLCSRRLRKKRRIPELEKWILNSASCSCDYSKFILKQRWPEAESVILQEGNPKILYSYIESSLKQRWPEAESSILKSAEFSYKYAKNIIRNRWPEAEEIILKHEKPLVKNSKYYYGLYSFKYASELIKNRWPELEDIIKDTPEALDYYVKEILKDVLPEELHNRMICAALSCNEAEAFHGKKYLELAKEIRIDFVKKLKRFNSDLTIKKLIEICEEQC